MSGARPRIPRPRPTHPLCDRASVRAAQMEVGLRRAFFREEYFKTTESTEDTEMNQPRLCELCVLGG